MAMNPPFEGDDIWSFSAHNTDEGMDMTDLRMSSSLGFYLPHSSADTAGFDVPPMDTDLRVSSSLLASNVPIVASEWKQEPLVDMSQAPVMALESFGALPPSNKKKRRRERDQVMEATIQYGNGGVPLITTPSSTSSSSSNRSPLDAHYGGRNFEPSLQDDFFHVESLPEQQLTPVLPRDHIMPFVTEFYEIRQAVVALRAQQYRILKQEKSRVGELKETIHDLSARLQTIVEKFHQLRCQALLHTSDVNRIFWLQPELNTCRVQLELYMNEINHTLSPNEAWKCTELVLEEHPFPISLKQKENVPRVVVRLITGACTNVTHVGPVEARVVTLSQTSPKPPEVINCVEKFRSAPYHPEAPDANGPTDTGHIAVFEQLNFLTGTRMRDFSLQFSCKVSLGHGKSELSETEPTPPFVVFTNGNQWNDIEGILLKWEAFGGSSNALWCRLANSLQRRYMLATLQNPDDPQRPISKSDFVFLFQTKIDPKAGTSPSCFASLLSCNSTFLYRIGFHCSDARHGSSLIPYPSNALSDLSRSFYLHQCLLPKLL